MLGQDRTMDEVDLDAPKKMKSERRRKKNLRNKRKGSCQRVYVLNSSVSLTSRRREKRQTSMESSDIQPSVDIVNRMIEEMDSETPTDPGTRTQSEDPVKPITAPIV